MVKKQKFKETEIGKIPENWEEKKVSDYLEIVNDSVNPKLYPDRIFFHYSIPAFDENKEPKMELGKEIKSNKNKINSNIILVSKLNPRFRRIWKIKNCKENSVCSTEFVVLKFKKKEYEKYINYFTALFISDEFTQYMLSNIRGTSSSHQRVSPQDILNFKFKFESKQFMFKIGKFLSDLTDKIELNQQMNKILESILQTIFKHWFVDFEFPNEEGKPYKSSGGEMVDSELGKIPKGWIHGKIGDIIFEKKDKVSISNSEYVVLSAVKTGNLVLSDEYFNKRVYSKNISKYKIVEKFDYAFNPARINIGSIGMLDKDLVGAVSPVYVVFRTTDDFYWFLNFFIKQENTKNKIKQLCSGTVRQVLDYKNFSSIELIIPTKKIIKKFNKLFLRIKDMIEFNNSQINTISQIRDTLLPKLMSGEIRVKIPEEKQENK